jgi:hypothetical protein
VGSDLNIQHFDAGTPVPGQQFEYGFDDIGNRTTVKSGGDSQGGTLRLSEYESNLRNQYTSRTVPESLDVIVLANANATVTVNGQAPYRHGEYFQASVPVGNCPDAVQYPQITVTATRSGYSTEQETGHIFVPGCAEAFEYDADGNLLHDDRWDYTWDAENRLVRVVARTTTGPQ